MNEFCCAASKLEALSPTEAVALQRKLATQVERQDRLGPIRTLAGIDVGFEADGQITRAAVVVLDATTLLPLDQAVAKRPTGFPYIPGLLSFREVPAILQAMSQLRHWPDLLLVDGHGTAHPRRCGIASHLGLALDLPSVGVGKQRLVGRHNDVPNTKGAWVPLTHKDETIGAVLRSRADYKPIYVSIGHRINLETALHWVIHCLSRYRLPETTRHAHRLASLLKD